MEKLTPPPTGQGPSEWFTGAVWFDQIYAGTEPSRTRVSSVRFSPGAHTAWHVHALGQTLHVTEGIGMVGTRDGSVIVMRPGDSIHTPLGEWHWHGATTGRFMTHLAIWDGTGHPDQPETTWGDHVEPSTYEHAQAGQA